MGIWDEQIPGGGTSTSPGGLGSGNFLQMLASMMGSAGRGPGAALGGGGGGGISPARVGAVPNPPPVPNVGGMQPAVGTPSGPAQATAQPGATEGGPGRFAPISPAGVNSQVEFNTKAGRNMAITQNALSGIGQFVQQYKQNQFQKKVQAAKASVLQKVMMSQDPQAQQQMAQLAQKDPKIAKIFEKQQADFAKYYDKAMTDPNSPEYYGFQQAYQELQAQAKTRDEMELIKQKIQAEMARAQQERATAALKEKEASQVGEVTPKVKFEEEQKGLRVAEQVSGSLERTREQVRGAIEAAEVRGKYLVKAYGTRAAVQSKALDYMIKDQNSLTSQLKELDKQAKDLQDRVANHPIATWATGEKEALPGKIQEINQRRANLLQRQQLLEQQIQQMQASGTIPPEEAQPAGTADSPIVVNPEDVK